MRVGRHGIVKSIDIPEGTLVTKEYIDRKDDSHYHYLYCVSWLAVGIGIVNTFVILYLAGR